MLSQRIVRSLFRRYLVTVPLIGMLVFATVVPEAHAQLSDSAPSRMPDPCAAPAPGETPLHPGDVVHVRTLDDPSLTRDYTIPADGSVQFWKGDRLQVTTMTTRCLQTRVVQLYAVNLAHPADIEVTVSYRIAVSGAVKTPGVYDADATMSIADVLAKAGGIASDGDDRRVTVTHDGVKTAATLAAATTAIDARIRSGDRIYVEQRSWLSRNVATAVTALSAVAYLAVSAFR